MPGAGSREERIQPQRRRAPSGLARHPPSRQDGAKSRNGRKGAPPLGHRTDGACPSLPRQSQKNMSEQHIALSGLSEHPLRYKLNNEVHARPPVPLEAPQLISYMAVTHNENDDREAEIAHLRALAAAYAVPMPEIGSEHLILDLGAFRVKWERHTEFSTYTFIRPPQPGDVADEGAIRAVPAGWLAEMPGHVLVATHVELRSAAEVPPTVVMSRLSPTEARQMVASQVADGAAWVFTEFLRTDGCPRFLIIDSTLTPRQAGRTVQRLVEIETYRMTALLAFPVAKEVGHLLGRAEGELADLMDRMGTAHTTEDERDVLAHLTRLAAEVERSVARSTFRFGAAAARSEGTRLNSSHHSISYAVFCLK